MFIVVFFLYALIITFEIIPLYKDKNKYKMFFYLFLSTFSMIITILLSLGVELPSPADPIKNIVISIFGKSN